MLEEAGACPESFEFERPSREELALATVGISSQHGGQPSRCLPMPCSAMRVPSTSSSCERLSFHCHPVQSFFLLLHGCDRILQLQQLDMRGVRHQQAACRKASMLPAIATFSHVQLLQAAPDPYRRPVQGWMHQKSCNEANGICSRLLQLIVQGMLPQGQRAGLSPCYLLMLYSLCSQLRVAAVSTRTSIATSFTAAPARQDGISACKSFTRLWVWHSCLS